MQTKHTHIDQSPHNIAIAPTHNQSPHEKSKLTFDKIYLKLNITTLVKMSIQGDPRLETRK